MKIGSNLYSLLLKADVSKNTSKKMALSQRDSRILKERKNKETDKEQKR
jgi:hypothetical protein